LAIDSDNDGAQESASFNANRATRRTAHLNGMAAAPAQRIQINLAPREEKNEATKERRQI